MAEQARIARFFAPLAQSEAGSFSLTDDAAALDVPAGRKLVITTDSVIVGTHVRADATPQQIAVKLMRRNLSDLAAMGATPWRYTLNLHTPAGLADAWFAGFAAALESEQKQFGLTLIGGDSTSGAGPLHATLTCYGLAGDVMRRNGAKAGDVVFVSGTIGDAALALQLGARTGFLAERYDAPTPRLMLGQMLQGIATSCIDISDGLVADAAQLARASNGAISLHAESIPLSNAAQKHRTMPDFWNVICGGDDYELLFTISSDAASELHQIAAATGIALTRIGTVTSGGGTQLLDKNGETIPIETGWEYN